MINTTWLIRQVFCVHVCRLISGCTGSNLLHSIPSMPTDLQALCAQGFTTLSRQPVAPVVHKTPRTSDAPDRAAIDFDGELPSV